MSFRTEIKIQIEPFMESHFFKWLSINNGMEIYSKRRVTSIYFDNDKLESYNDSIEGTVPRKKIRLRTYNEFKFNEFQKVLLEKKISSIEGRYKTSIKISNYMKLINNGVYENNYGIMKPIIKVNYLRSYYKCKNFRFTLDKDINYSTVKITPDSYKFHDKKIVLELKSTSLHDFDKFLDENQFKKTRFSKYCNGIKFLFGNLADA